MVTRLKADQPQAEELVVAPPAKRRVVGLSPRAVLIVVVVGFLLMAGAVLSLTPPWEANDEPFHVINVETLVGGHMYHITPFNDGNLESIQAPLYYMVLAAYQKLTGEPKQALALAYGPVADGQKHGNFLHNIPTDGMSQRFVALLRLPSLLFGVLTVLFTFLAARRLTSDRWTPVVAAAIVAGVPKFAFVSGVINNDNLSNVLGAAALFVALSILARPPTSRRALVIAGGGLGLLAGALVLTKVPAAVLIPGLLVAIWIVAPRGRQLLTVTASFAIGALLVCGWWLVYNQIHYGDPLALHAILVHQRATMPSVLDIPPILKQFFVEIPKKIYSTFWYDSGWNQFSWNWYWYLPFWILAALGIAGLFAKGRRRLSTTTASQRAITGDAAGSRRAITSDGLLVCTVIALGGLASVWVVGAQTNTEEGRYAFIALPAIALLIAVGYERLRLWIPLRFALPVIGLVGTLLAIRYDVIAAYAPH